MKIFVAFFLSLLFSVTSAGVVKSDPVKIKLKEKNMDALCSGVKQCLFTDLAGCSESNKKKDKDIKYDADFCAPFQELQQRGLDIRSAKAREIFINLGKRYRVTYKVSGTIPINAQMMDYLLDHMPFAARMINAYQGTKYTIVYTSNNRRDFKADNGGNLAGKIGFVLADKTGRQSVFFGHGTAKVLMWRLYGVALVFLDYHAVDKSSFDYELRSVVFPANAMINSVMNMGIFKNVVKDKMLEIVGHVENSAHRYAAGDKNPIDKSGEFKKGWVKQDLDGFNAVIQSSGYIPPKKSQKK